MNEVPANVLAEYKKMAHDDKVKIVSLLTDGYSPQVINYAANRLFNILHLGRANHESSREYSSRIL